MILWRVWKECWIDYLLVGGFIGLGILPHMALIAWWAGCFFLTIGALSRTIRCWRKQRDLAKLNALAKMIAERKPVEKIVVPEEYRHLLN